MKLLAFETATEGCSVAVWIDGEVHERFEIAPRRHAELALPWADAMLAEAGIRKSQLDAIAVGRGPGAFTGVRLGVALAQGIALALDLPVLPVSTLAALAMRAGGMRKVANPRGSLLGANMDPGVGSGMDAAAQPEPTRVLAAIDARMGEVYAGAFRIDPQDVSALMPEAVLAPDRVVLPDESGDWQGVGTGFAAVDGALQRRLAEHMRSIDAGALPHAGDVAALAVLAFARGEAIAPERLEPAYLRDNVAMTIREQQLFRDSR